MWGRSFSAGGGEGLGAVLGWLSRCCVLGLPSENIIDGICKKANICIAKVCSYLYSEHMFAIKTHTAMPKQPSFAETEEGIASVLRHPSYLSAQLSDRQAKPSALTSRSPASRCLPESAQTLSDTFSETDTQDSYLHSRPLKRWQKKLLGVGAALLFVLGAWATLTNHGNDPQGDDPSPEPLVSDSAAVGLE